MWKAIVDLIDKLAEQPRVLLSVLLLIFGAALFVLGAAGGVSGYLPIPDDVGRYLAAAGGATLLIVGIFLAVGPKQSPQPRAKSFDARFTRLVSVGPGKMEAKGTIRRLPPDGYKLMLVRFFPEGRFAPVNAEVNFEKRASGYEWAAYDCPINIRAGQRRTVAAYLIGKSGSVSICRGSGKVLLVAADGTEQVLARLESADRRHDQAGRDRASQAVASCRQ